MVEPFLDVILDPRAVVMELYDEDEGVPSGLLMMNKIIPNFDAEVHFAQWNGNTRNKEPIYHGMLRLLVEEFNLRRVSTMIPFSHRGLERMMKRLGFQQEGVKRKGNIFEGEWVDLALYGILKEEIPDA
jgi:hypothetical protein